VESGVGTALYSFVNSTALDLYTNVDLWIGASQFFSAYTSRTTVPAPTWWGLTGFTAKYYSPEIYEYLKGRNKNP
jgi:hypothetical protein